MSLPTASKPREPAAIVKVSFFLKSPSSSHNANSNNNNNNNNTQVWISLPLLAATSARSLVVAAFRSAADRFGGAQLEDHPNRLLPFLYTHGEFLYLDARETPLLQIPEVHELVFNEGKQVLTVALTTEDEYHRLNPQRPLSSLQAETRRDTTTSNDASSYHNGKKTSPTTVPAPNQQNTSFRGRVRAGSILPEAFAFDPIQDPRGRPHESSRSAAASSSSSSSSPRVVVKRENLTDSFSSMRSVDGEDIFPLPPSASSSAPSASPRAAHEEEGSSPSASPHRAEVGTATLLFVTGRGVEHTVSLTYKRETTCSALVMHALFELQKKFSRPSVLEGDEDQKEFHQFLQLPEHCVALHYQKKSGGYRRFLFTDAIPVSRGLRPAPPTLQLVVLDPSEVPIVAAPRSRFADLITSGALPPLLQPDRSPMTASSQRSVSRREPSVPSDSASSALRTVTTAKPWNEGSATEQWVMEKRLIAAEQTYVLRGSTAEMARSRANEETEMRRQLHTAETNLRDALAVRDERRKKLESLLRERAALTQQVQMQQTTIEEGTAARQTIASIEVVASWVRTDVASSRHRHLELHKAIAELRAAHQS